MTQNVPKDYGIRPLKDSIWMNHYKGGYLNGWERVGVGIKPPVDQGNALISRGVNRLQFNFNKGYGDAPLDMQILE